MSDAWTELTFKPSKGEGVIGTTLTGLIANTNYDIRVITTCSTGTATSNIIQATTLGNASCGIAASTRNVNEGNPVTETWDMGCVGGSVSIPYNVNSIGANEELLIEVLYNNIVIASAANLTNGNSGTLNFTYSPTSPNCSIQLRFTVSSTILISNMNFDATNSLGQRVTYIDVNGVVPTLVGGTNVPFTTDNHQYNTTQLGTNETLNISVSAATSGTHVRVTDSASNVFCQNLMKGGNNLQFTGLTIDNSNIVNVEIADGTC